MVSLLVVTVAYLIGSIPFGYLIVKLTSGGDIRETGSGGTGATNVSRRAGKAAGVLTLVLDALKGACAVLFASVATGNDVTTSANWVVAGAAIAAILGHVFPVWLGFRGGKGVATAVGVFFMVAPFALLCASLVFVAVVSLTRYVSLASLCGAASIPLFLGLQKFLMQAAGDNEPALAASVVGALLIVFAHRGNISRLMNGTEPKFT